MGVVIDGTFINCHTFNHANIVPYAYTTTACLPMRYEIFNAAASSGTSNLNQICSTVISEGGYEAKEQLYVQANVTSTTLSSTLRPLCSIRLAPGRLDAIVKWKQISVACGTPNDLAQWRLILNGTLGGGTNWRAHSDSTNVQIDDSSTTISGGRNLETGFAQTGSGSTLLGAEFFEAQLGRNSYTQTSDVLTLCAVQCTSNPQAYWSIAWVELV